MSMRPSDAHVRVRSFATFALAALVAAAVTVPATGYAGGGEWNSRGRVAGAWRPEVPENYHARYDPDFAARLAKRGAPIARASVSDAEAAALTKLSATVPALHVSRDDVSQFPVMVLSYEPGAYLGVSSSKKTADAETSARTFLRTNKALYGMSDADLATLRTRYVTSPEGGATIVKFDQYVDDLPLFDTEFAVTMTKTNDVVATSGRVYAQVGAGADAHTRFTLPANDAIVRAVADLTGRAVAVSDFAVAKADAGGGYSTFGYLPDGATDPSQKFLGEDVRVRRVLYPLAAGRFVAAYYLELWIQGEPAGSGPVFSYVISAEDGALMFRNNLTQYDAFTYRTYADNSGDFRPWDGPTGTVGTPHPTGFPNGFQAPFINPAPLITIESLLGSSDPWLPSGANVTTGNNTEAYLDITGADGFSAGDIRGNATAANVFDAQYDSAQAAETATNRQAAVIGMFYQVNWLHDIWYQHGFTEAAGNAQTDNYGRGGVGNDSLKAEGQDQSGTDNANMSTPADGGRPRMQMYKFTAGGLLSPTRDGTFDMLIVGHEMGHYISNRLIGNASGLSNRQGNAMGEGWGDFNCVLTTVQDTDNIEGTTFAVGGQTDIFFCGGSFMDNYYYSIRRYPYSSSKLKNPLTFKDIGNQITTYPGVSGNPCLSLTGSPSEVHNAGEIWAEMLWQCYAGLARAYGTATARQKILQYYIDGMKATPTSPTYTEARDGVIAAANGANGFANPKDAQILWQAFAYRGAGTSAVSPARTATLLNAVTQDFTAAPALPDDTVGVYTSGTFFERDVLFGGGADQAFSFGAGGLVALVGNWDGSTGVGAGSADTPGLYDPATGNFFLKNTNAPGAADLVFSFGPGGSIAVPIVGDWDGNGSTTIGVYIPASGAFFLRNSNSPGAADIVFSFGPSASPWLPIAGDWNNDGIDTVGLYDAAAGFFFLKNANSNGPADLVFGFGPAGGFVPIAGDWNSDGTDTIGIFNPTNGLFYLRNANSAGAADETIFFGPSGAQPVAGNFDGQ